MPRKGISSVVVEALTCDHPKSLPLTLSNVFTNSAACIILNYSCISGTVSKQSDSIQFTREFIRFLCRHLTPSDKFLGSAPKHLSAFPYFFRALSRRERYFDSHLEPFQCGYLPRRPKVYPAYRLP